MVFELFLQPGVLHHPLEAQSLPLRDQYFRDQVPGLRGHLLARRQRVVQLHDRCGVVPVFVGAEGQAAEQHLHEQHPQAPHICPEVIREPLNHLVGVVARRACAPGVEASSRHLDGKPEVAQPHLKVCTDHDVLGLDVAMEDASGVHRVQGRQQLPDHSLALVFSQVTLAWPFFAFHESEKVTAWDEGEHHNEFQGSTEQLQQRHDVRHVDQCQMELNLVFDVLDEVLLGDFLLAHAFQAKNLVVLNVPGDVGETYHAAADDAAELEPGDEDVAPFLADVVLITAAPELLLRPDCFLAGFLLGGNHGGSLLDVNALRLGPTEPWPGGLGKRGWHLALLPLGRRLVWREVDPGCIQVFHAR